MQHPRQGCQVLGSRMLLALLLLLLLLFLLLLLAS
jgi:hypothetical protein